MPFDENMIESARALADKTFPRLTAFAPNVRVTNMANRPDVAGFYDPENKAVQLNRDASLNMNEQQLSGLISLERSRGLFNSPLGKPFLDNFQLTPPQRQFWDKFYLSSSGDAPSNRDERDQILKATILSRLLVGDVLPNNAPPLNESQMNVSNLVNSYARMAFPNQPKSIQPMQKISGR